MDMYIYTCIYICLKIDWEHTQSHRTKTSSAHPKWVQWAEAQVATEAAEEIWNNHAWTQFRWACIGVYQGYATKKCATTHEIYLYTYIYIEYWDLQYL